MSKVLKLRTTHRPTRCTKPDETVYSREDEKKIAQEMVDEIKEDEFDANDGSGSFLGLDGISTDSTDL